MRFGRSILRTYQPAARSGRVALVGGVVIGSLEENSPAVKRGNTVDVFNDAFQVDTRSIETVAIELVRHHVRAGSGTDWRGTSGRIAIAPRRIEVRDFATRGPNGGAIAVGHPLGASGARLALTAARQLQRSGGRYALVSLCIGGGQGLAVVLERV